MKLLYRQNNVSESSNSSLTSSTCHNSCQPSNLEPRQSTATVTPFHIGTTGQERQQRQTWASACSLNIYGSSTTPPGPPPGPQAPGLEFPKFSLTNGSNARTGDSESVSGRVAVLSDQTTVTDRHDDRPSRRRPGGLRGARARPQSQAPREDSGTPSCFPSPLPCR